MDWTDTLAELIRRTTSDLPADAEAALRRAADAEAPGSQAELILRALAENTVLARRQSTPLCQDTGTLTFFWDVPPGTDTAALEQAARGAVALATRNGWLRRNTIDTLTGRSVDSNVAEGCPVCHFEQRSEVKGQRSEVRGQRSGAGGQEAGIDVWLLQKGGGSENMSRQFSLPDETLGAGRDLEGVRRCLLHAVWEAQGFGCAPGVLGVCIGADRAEGFLAAKRQVLRPLDDAAPEPELAALERRVLAEANALGIGPMGMGGTTTLLGVKIAARTRLPASYFVTVAYLCWACRRRGLRVPADSPLQWLN
jgi:fumarate hydratase class I